MLAALALDPPSIDVRSVELRNTVTALLAEHRRLRGEVRRLQAGRDHRVPLGAK